MVAIEFARYAYMAGYTIFTSEDVVCDEECDSYWSVKILALVSVWIATVVNCFTAKMAARVVHVNIALKVLLISMILIFGCAGGPRAARRAPRPARRPDPRTDFRPRARSPSVIAAARSSSTIRGNFTQPQAWRASATTTASDVGQAFVSVMWTYSGYTSITHTAEELHDPAHDLSSIIIVGMSIVCGIYFSVRRPPARRPPGALPGADRG